MCSALSFPPLEISDHIVVSAYFDFPLNSKQNVPFHSIAFDYSHANWDALLDHLRNIPWEGVFKLSASAVTSGFFYWVHVGIQFKYMCLIVSIRSNPTYLHGFQQFVLLP